MLCIQSTVDSVYNAVLGGASAAPTTTVRTSLSVAEPHNTTFLKRQAKTKKISKVYTYREGDYYKKIFMPYCNLCFITYVNWVQ